MTAKQFLGDKMERFIYTVPEKYTLNRLLDVFLHPLSMSSQHYRAGMTI